MKRVLIAPFPIPFRGYNIYGQTHYSLHYLVVSFSPLLSHPPSLPPLLSLCLTLSPSFTLSHRFILSTIRVITVLFTTWLKKSTGALSSGIWRVDITRVEKKMLRVSRLWLGLLPAILAEQCCHCCAAELCVLFPRL